MEKEFAEIFSGLKRNFGVAYLDEFTIDEKTGKKKPKKYGWSFKEITEKHYLDHIKGIIYKDNDLFMLFSLY